MRVWHLGVKSLGWAGIALVAGLGFSGVAQAQSAKKPGDLTVVPPEATRGSAALRANSYSAIPRGATIVLLAQDESGINVFLQERLTTLLRQKGFRVADKGDLFLTYNFVGKAFVESLEKRFQDQIRADTSINIPLSTDNYRPSRGPVRERRRLEISVADTRSGKRWDGSIEGIVGGSQQTVADAMARILLNKLGQTVRPHFVEVKAGS